MHRAGAGDLRFLALVLAAFLLGICATLASAPIVAQVR
jgi:hypothetical protein